MANTQTAAIYARISTDKRKGSTDEGATVATQIKACKAFIKTKGWTVGEIYTDNDISATTGAERPDFERMLSDKPPIVVYREQTRIERGSDDSLDRFLLAGCEGYGADGTRATVENASSELVTRLFSLLGKFEGKQKAERQKLRYAADAESGKVHLARPVFGNDHKTGKLIPEEAEAIRTAAKDLVNGDTTFFQIAKRWNAQGLRTPKSANMGGKAWEAGTVRQFFQRERLMGKRTYNGVTRDLANWEPLLDEQTFSQIQTLIESRKTGKRGTQGNRHRPHLLTGIATCGHKDENGKVCGNGLNVAYRGTEGSPRYYRCTTPNHLTRTADKLDKLVVGRFIDLMVLSGADELLNPDVKTNGIADLRTRKLTLEKEHAAWSKEAGEAKIPMSYISARESAHEAEIAEIDAQLMEYEKTAIFAFVFDEMRHGPEALWERWESQDMGRKRRIVRAMYDKIEVLPAKQGKRFSAEYIRMKPSALHMQLLELMQ